MMEPEAPRKLTKLNPKRRSGRIDPKDPRHEWARQMRLLLSPPEMLLPSGDIDQEYFRPHQVVDEVERKWGTEERDLLYQGLEEFGVGRWRKIREELLSDWDEHSLRMKTARLLGTQSLVRYIGWKGDRAAVDAAQANNAAVGEATGCWKAGMLVEDGQGSVAAALQAREKEVGPTEFTEEAAAKRRKLMSPANRPPLLGHTDARRDAAAPSSPTVAATANAASHPASAAAAATTFAEAVTMRQQASDARLAGDTAAAPVDAYMDSDGPFIASGTAAWPVQTPQAANGMSDVQSDAQAEAQQLPPTPPGQRAGVGGDSSGWPSITPGSGGGGKYSMGSLGMGAALGLFEGSPATAGLATPPRAPVPLDEL
mmetsp:Transcript_16492/g.49377  ORF Transcript_16492/g.49377 Transcript_16492/m.49377 type:complete len:370 (-) Transcript_16492:415-1524(-)